MGVYTTQYFKESTSTWDDIVNYVVDTEFITGLPIYWGNSENTPGAIVETLADGSPGMSIPEDRFYTDSVDLGIQEWATYHVLQDMVKNGIILKVTMTASENNEVKIFVMTSFDAVKVKRNDEIWFRCSAAISEVENPI